VHLGFSWCCQTTIQMMTYRDSSGMIRVQHSKMVCWRCLASCKCLLSFLINRTTIPGKLIVGLLWKVNQVYVNTIREEMCCRYDVKRRGSTAELAGVYKASRWQHEPSCYSFVSTLHAMRPCIYVKVDFGGAIGRPTCIYFLVVYSILLLVVDHECC
jgi:hypothetical protein